MTAYPRKPKSEGTIRQLLAPEPSSHAVRRLEKECRDLREELNRHRKRGAQLEEALAFERQMVVQLRVRLSEAVNGIRNEG